MRRTLATMLLVGCLLVLLPGTALAHASFDVRQVPAGSTQDLVLRVPLERDAANDRVEVLVPGQIAVTACAATEGWSCEEAMTADGDTVLTLVRGPDGPGDAERFALTVTAPVTEGVYAFPTIQTYDDGTEAAWIGQPGSDQPAPRLQVGDETAPVESNGEGTPHTPLASETTAATPEPTTTPSTAPEPTEEPSADPAEDSADDAGTSQPGSAGDDEGPSPLLLVVGALLAVGALAGAIARYRSVTD